MGLCCSRYGHDPGFLCKLPCEGDLVRCCFRISVLSNLVSEFIAPVRNPFPVHATIGNTRFEERLPVVPPFPSLINFFTVPNLLRAASVPFLMFSGLLFMPSPGLPRSKPNLVAITTCSLKMKQLYTKIKYLVVQYLKFIMC